MESTAGAEIMLNETNLHCLVFVSVCSQLLLFCIVFIYLNTEVISGQI